MSSRPCLYLTDMTSHDIIRLGHQGDGIAEGPVFAPLTLPGETVTGTLNGNRLEDIRIENPSDQRVKAPCRHFKACGGCQVQHASDAFVAEWKLDIVQSALASHGISTVVSPIHTSPAQSRRRATMSVRRTKKGATVGFHGRGSGTIVEVPDCKLVDPRIIDGFPVAEALAIAGASRKAELSVAITVSEKGLDLAVTGGKPLDGPLRMSLAQIAQVNGLARLVWDDETIAQETPPVQTFGPASVCPPAGAFLQATIDGETALLAAVQDCVGDAGLIADLFAGCGTFALPLAQNAEVHAVESDPEMLAALDQGWRMAKGLKRVTHEARDLFRRPLMPDELRKLDAVVIDPPRAGAEAQIAEIVKSSVPRLAYVSCSPVTFARDASALIAAGWSLDWVQVVDQFRWSSHVELAAQLTASHISKK